MARKLTTHIYANISSGMRQIPTDTSDMSDDTCRKSTGTPRIPFDMRRRSDGTWHMSSNTRHMSSNTRHMSSNTRHMSSNTWHMSSDTRHMSSDTRQPLSDTRQLLSDIWHISSDIRAVSTDIRKRLAEIVRLPFIPGFSAPLPTIAICVDGFAERVLLCPSYFDS